MTAMEDKFETIIAHCLQETSADPVANALRLMADPAISMHGPEHHLLDGAALLTAYHNAGGRFDLRKALLELKERASLMPGATCGYWGVCGSAASVGAFESVPSTSGATRDHTSSHNCAVWKSRLARFRAARFAETVSRAA